jgi:glycosyltransferase involved in cell wall biosynthesis
MLQGGDAGILVNSRDPSGFAAAVASLFADPELSRRLTARARKQLEEYTPAVVCEEWRSVYSALLPVASHKPEVLASGV